MAHGKLTAIGVAVAVVGPPNNLPLVSENRSSNFTEHWQEWAFRPLTLGHPATAIPEVIFGDVRLMDVRWEYRKLPARTAQPGVVSHNAVYRPVASLAQVAG